MNRIYNNNESLIVLDPTEEMLPFFRSLNPGYAIESVPPASNFIPSFQRCRKLRIGMDKSELDGMLFSELESLHSQRNDFKESGNGVSLLDLKKEMAFRKMANCDFCGWECNINRYNESGNCGLNFTACHAPVFTHISEESVINPAILINFGGCSQACKFCIMPEVSSPHGLTALNVLELWNDIHRQQDKSTKSVALEFAGGDPTPSVAWALEILSRAPEGFLLPVIWNSNLYASESAIDLLDGVIDVYLPDFNFGNDDCAEKIAGVTDYFETAKRAVKAMIRQNARLIFRLLVLPNHMECCHKKVLEFLSQFRDRIWVSILEQYVPENKAYLEPDLNRRPTTSEISAVENYAQQLGLRNISTEYGGFWDE